MKSKLLITLLSLIATSTYAQPSIPAVGMPPPAVRAEMSRAAMPFIPQPAIQRPVQTNQASRSVGAVPVNPQEQENIARIIALPPTQPAVGASGGNGGIPKPANDAKAPTGIGASQRPAQAQAHAIKGAVIAPLVNYQPNF